MKIVALNGPPRSGKEALTQELMTALVREGIKPQPIRFADALNEMAKVLVWPWNERKLSPEEISENFKHVSLAELLRFPAELTFAELKLNLRRCIETEFLGKGFLTQMTLQRIKRSRADVIVIPDLGYQVELTTLNQAFNPADICVVKIERFGSAFADDGRRYVLTLAENNFLTISTDADLLTPSSQLISGVFQWLRR